MKKPVFMGLMVVSGLLLQSYAQAQPSKMMRFHAGLSGAQEVTNTPSDAQPGVATETQGKAFVRINKALDKLQFRLAIFDGKKITQAHFHCAGAGSNGPVVAFLLNLAPVGGPGGKDFDGLAEADMLTNEDIVPNDLNNEVCPMPVNNIASLFAAMKAGYIYVNVHSEDSPPGVIRGQMLPMKRY